MPRAATCRAEVGAQLGNGLHDHPVLPQPGSAELGLPSGKESDAPELLPPPDPNAPPAGDDARPANAHGGAPDGTLPTVSSEAQGLPGAHGADVVRSGQRADADNELAFLKSFGSDPVDIPPGLDTGTPSPDPSVSDDGGESGCRDEPVRWDRASRRSREPSHSHLVAASIGTALLVVLLGGLAIAVAMSSDDDPEIPIDSRVLTDMGPDLGTSTTSSVPDGDTSDRSVPRPAAGAGMEGAPGLPNATDSGTSLSEGARSTPSAESVSTSTPSPPAGPTPTTPPASAPTPTTNSTTTTSTTTTTTTTTTPATTTTTTLPMDP
jgi:hypothetical protein